MKAACLVMTATALLAGGPNQASAQPGRGSARCEAAAAVILLFQARDPMRVVVLEDAQTRHPPRSLGSWRKEAPPVALEAVLIAEATSRPLQHCNRLRDQAKAAGVIVSTGGSVHRLRTTILRISLPVLSDDGRHALLLRDQEQGPRAGVGEVVHLRKVDGGWFEVDTLPLWES